MSCSTSALTQMGQTKNRRVGWLTSRRDPPPSGGAPWGGGPPVVPHAASGDPAPSLDDVDFTDRLPRGGGRQGWISWTT